MTFTNNNYFKSIKKYVESGNINFIIGSGASIKAISVLGDLENSLTMLIRDFRKSENKDILQKITDLVNNFIEDSLVPNQILLNNPAEKEEVENTLADYKKFLKLIYDLLLYRGMDKIPKKINIFTTNYDLFHEVAAEEIGIPYNDGGNGVINRYFSSKNFQKRIYRMSDYYSYQYEEPIINIVKLHGSINWSFESNSIKINNYVTMARITEEGLDENGYLNGDITIPIILPTKQKFVRTLMEHIYYDLSRYYANELEREQSVIFCFGFSFEDEHIRSITKRALGNPSLTLLIFPYSEHDEQKLLSYFKPYNNVKIIRIVHSEDEGKKISEVIFLKEYHEDINRVKIDFSIFLSFLEFLHNNVSESKVFV